MNTAISLCSDFPSTQLSKLGLPLQASLFLWNRGGLVNGETPVFPDSFTQIYILFLICIRIGPPKMHRRFIELPCL